MTIATSTELICFLVLSVVVVAGALGVVLLSNIVYSAFLLGGVFMAVAGLYLLLNASFVAAAHHLYSVMGIVEASSRTGVAIEKVASVFFVVGEQLHLHWFSKQIHEYQAFNQWQAETGLSYTQLSRIAGMSIGNNPPAE